MKPAMLTEKLCNYGRSKLSLRILHSSNTDEPSHSSYACLLKACIKKKSLLDGKLIHAQIITSTKFETLNTYTKNNVLTMYTKCGSIADARRVFDQMPYRDVVTWTAMVSAYVREGEAKEALRLFNQMRRETPIKPNQYKPSIKPNQYTYASVLPAISDLKDIEEGKKIHEELARDNFESDVFVASALVDMYAKCGSLEDARQVFDKMLQRDLVSWNAMIEGCLFCGAPDEAMELYYEMQKAGVVPDGFTFSRIVSACADFGELQEVHEEIKRRGFESNVFVGNALVDMYAKNGNLQVARKVFDEMSQRDLSSWNVMIRGYVQNGFLDEALRVFDKIPERDAVSCNALITGYAERGLFEEARKLFCEIPRRNVVSWNTMIAACVTCGQDGVALELFYEMLLTDTQPNQFTFAIILPACANLRAVEQGKKIHEEIDRAGFQFNVFVGSSLVDMYAKCKSVENARNVFDRMPRKNVVTWTSMIAGYAQNGHEEDALELFREMQLAGLKADPKAFVVVLPACANSAALKQGKEVHEIVLRSGLQSNVFVGSALVDMYAKCGSIEDARSIFDKMPHRGVVSWNVMIVGYAMHGVSTEALRLFDRMQHSGINPDHVTFVGVLTACCHAGLVDKGWHYFKSMNNDYQITPMMRHYSCMVDLLGRAGQMVEARDFINKMPIIPDATVWKSLLGACRIYTNVGLGELAAEHLFELDPENPAPYVLLSNIYAQAGRWDDIEKVRKMMKDRGVLKKPGCSWIEVNKQVHAFLGGDR